MSGFPAPLTSAPGTFSVGGLLTLPGGKDTSGLTAASTVNPVSGTPFTPDIAQDCTLLVPIAATTVGTVTITVGGVTYVPVSNLVAASEPTYSVPVRRNQAVTITITGVTVTIGTCTIIPD